MSITNHIKEHSKLGLPFPGGGNSTLITVGNGGMYSTLEAAVTAIEGMTRITELASFTGSITGAGTPATVDVRYLDADSGTPLSGHEGKVVAVTVAGSIYFMAQVSTSSRLNLFYPAPHDVTSQTVTISSVIPACIFLLPGTNLTITSAVQLPKFTTLYGIRDTCSITFAAAGASLDCITSGDATEIYIEGVNLYGYNKLTNPAVSNSCILYFPASGISGWQMHTNFGIANLSMFAGHNDGVLFNSSANTSIGSTLIAGGFHIHNCFLNGFYDVVRGVSHRLLSVNSSYIISKCQTSLDTSAACVALGSPTSADNYMSQNLIFSDNILESYMIGPGGSGYISPIDIRNVLSSNAKVIVRGNTIRARRYAADTTNAYGVVVTNATGANTPYIECLANTFDVSIIGAGGAANTMHSVNAAYAIQRAGNSVVTGSSATLGSNTAAMTTY